MSYHWSHPEHPLGMVNMEGRYICDGCSMDGIGPRYRCEWCDFDLHEECIYAPSEVEFRGQRCYFRSKPLCVCYEMHGKRVDDCEGCRICNACGNDVKGFVYHCAETGFDFHPRCTNLNSEILVLGVKFRLTVNHGASECFLCKRGSLRGCVKDTPVMSYVSDSEKYYCNLHVHCMMDMAMQGIGNTMTLEGLERLLETKFKKRGRGKKWLKILKIFLTTVLSILLGDPSTIIASVLVNLFSQG